MSSSNTGGEGTTEDRNKTGKLSVTLSTLIESCFHLSSELPNFKLPKSRIIHGICLLCAGAGELAARKVPLRGGVPGGHTSGWAHVVEVVEVLPSTTPAANT